MSSSEFIATKRSDLGKKASKKIRKERKIPAVLYGYKGTTCLELEEDQTRHLLESLPSAHQLMTLKVTDPESNETTEHSVMIKEIQTHSYKDFLLHMDFQELDPEKPIVVRVPIKPEGQALGVKMGGFIQMVARDVPVECLPANIPDHITIDVSNMNLNSYMRVNQLNYPDNVTPKARDNYPVVNVRGRVKGRAATQAAAAATA